MATDTIRITEATPLPTRRYLRTPRLGQPSSRYDLAWADSDFSRQQECDETRGHTLEDLGHGIIRCMHCGAEWHDYGC